MNNSNSSESDFLDYNSGNQTTSSNSSSFDSVSDYHDLLNHKAGIYVVHKKMITRNNNEISQYKNEYFNMLLNIEDRRKCINIVGSDLLRIQFMGFLLKNISPDNTEKCTITDFLSDYELKNQIFIETHSFFAIIDDLKGKNRIISFTFVSNIDAFCSTSLENNSSLILVEYEKFILNHKQYISKSANYHVLVIFVKKYTHINNIQNYMKKNNIFIFLEHKKSLIHANQFSQNPQILHKPNTYTISMLINFIVNNELDKFSKKNTLLGYKCINNQVFSLKVINKEKDTGKEKLFFINNKVFKTSSNTFPLPAYVKRKKKKHIFSAYSMFVKIEVGDSNFKKLYEYDTSMISICQSFIYADINHISEDIYIISGPNEQYFDYILFQVQNYEVKRINLSNRDIPVIIKVNPFIITPTIFFRDVFGKINNLFNTSFFHSSLFNNKKIRTILSKRELSVSEYVITIKIIKTKLQELEELFHNESHTKIFNEILYNENKRVCGKISIWNFQILKGQFSEYFIIENIEPLIKLCRIDFKTINSTILKIFEKIEYQIKIC